MECGEGSCASPTVPNGPTAQRGGARGPGAQMLSEVNGTLDRVRLGPWDRLLVLDLSPVNLLSLAARTGQESGQEAPQGLPLRSLQKSCLSQVLTMKVSQRDHTCTGPRGSSGAASGSLFPLEHPAVLTGFPVGARPRMQAPQPDSEHMPWAECVPVHAAAPTPPPLWVHPVGTTPQHSWLPHS